MKTFSSIILFSLFCNVAKGYLTYSTLQNIAQNYSLPSIAYAYVKNGTIEAYGTYGTRQWGTDQPVQITDRYHLGSDTKAMTSLMAAILVESGKLGWNSTLGEVFPDWTLTPVKRNITLHQLLSHTSGLPNDGQTFINLLSESLTYTGDNEGTYSGNLNEIREQVISRGIQQIPLISTPGTQFHYSNFGYMTVGHIVETLWNSTWDQLITEQIYEPFKFENAGLGCQVTLGEIDAPLPHVLNETDGSVKWYLAGPNCDNPVVVGPAGIAHMSILDFAKWASWNSGQGKRPPYIVSPQMVAMMHQPVIEVDIPNPEPGTPRTGGYGLGWGEFHPSWSSKPWIFHEGSNEKNVAQVWLDTDADVAMVFVTNIGGQNATDALNEAARTLASQ